MQDETKKEPSKRSIRVEPLLGVAALLLLLGGCFLVIRPFISALMWAIILAYALHPLQRVFTRWFRGYRTLAACFVTLTMAVLVAGPIVLIGVSVAEDGKDLAKATRDWFMQAPDKTPAWLAGLPVVGDEADHYWTAFAEDKNQWIDQLDKQVQTQPGVEPSEDEGSGVNDTDGVNDADGVNGADGANDESASSLVGSAVETLEEEMSRGDNADSPHVIVWIGKFLSWARTGLLASAKAVGQGVTQVLFSVFLAFFFLRDAPVLSERLGVAVERLAGARGKHLIKVAGDTVRGVIFGILGTALAQAVVAGIGFWIAGVPGAVLLSVLVFFIAVIPYGPPLVWIPATLWLFAQDEIGYAIFLLIWGLAVISSVDNFVRPFLISQGSKMPFALIFCGVIGGVLGFGLVGVFLGPTLLAVAFRLIDEWSAGKVDNLNDTPELKISALPSGD